MRNNAPGLCLMGAVLSLFGALTMIAWHEDAVTSIDLPPTTSEHICDRLSHELAQQVRARMISRLGYDNTIQRCWKEYK